MVRLFFGLELPAELRERIGALAGGIERARFVPEENLHITLRFIGEVDEPTMQDIALAADGVRFEPVQVTLGGAGHFETRGRVSAVWLGVEPSAPLIALRQRIEAALVRQGLPPERRRFKPHVTVARLNQGRPDEIRRWLAANTMFRAVPFTADRFVLFSSALGRRGPSYIAECGFPRGNQFQFEAEDIL